VQADFSGDEALAAKWYSRATYAGSFGDCCFCLAHWLLAVHYHKASKNVPKLLKGEQIVEAKSTKVLTWIGIVLSVLLPSCESFFGAKFYQQYFQGQPTTFFEYAESIATTSILLFMVFTGVILIISLCRIYSFMKFFPEGERADFKAMLIHSSAFGLFMISALILTVTATLYFFFSSVKEAEIWYNASDLLYNILQFISQCFIIVVIKRLGRKLEQEE
jgi:hypothetical protein